jgi:hypothetical protein
MSHVLAKSRLTYFKYNYKRSYNQAIPFNGRMLTANWAMFPLSVPA